MGYHTGHMYRVGEVRSSISLTWHADWRVAQASTALYPASRLSLINQRLYGDGQNVRVCKRSTHCRDMTCPAWSAVCVYTLIVKQYTAGRTRLCMLLYWTVNVMDHNQYTVRVWNF